MIIYFIILLYFLLSWFAVLILATKRRHSRILQLNDYSRDIDVMPLLAIIAVPVLLLGLSMGLRHDVGADYDSYITIFQELAAGNQRYIDRFEPIFVKVNLLFDQVGLGPNYVLLFFYFLSLLFLIASVFKMGYTSFTMYAVAFVSLIGIGPVFGMTNTVRQDFVVSLALLSIAAFRKRRSIGAMLPAGIGFGFHYSSPIILSMIAIPRKNLGPFFWGVAVLLSIKFYVFASSFLPLVIESISYFLGRFEGYADVLADHGGVSGVGVRVYFEALLFFVLSFFSSRLPPHAVLIFNIAFVGVLLRFALQDYAILFRVSSYFYVFAMLAVPWFVKAFYGWHRNAYVMLATLYSVALFARNVASEQFVPYQLAPVIGG